jgi:putative SOS response-associated peptidase YedK
MCGRFTLRTPLNVLIEHFDLDVRASRQLELFEPRYNIAPTQEIAAVWADAASGQRSITLLRWGLVPAWSKEGAKGPPMINARAETLAEKPAFRNALRGRRCLIPADGFYEWQQSASGGRGKKQPYYIHRADFGPFAFAGLWESWTAASGGPTVESCTIVTTDANASLSDLHDRMPVVLAPNDYATWLDPTIADPAMLAHLLSPCGDDELVADPVTTHVNRVANDDPRCIDVHPSLF